MVSTIFFSACVFAVIAPGHGLQYHAADDVAVNESSHHFCMHGHLAPKFYLLGTPKSGTTFFFAPFSRSLDIVQYKPGPKEPRFHSKEAWVFAKRWSIKNKDKWLSHYPTCTAALSGKVAVDCTPGYFGSSTAPFNIHRAYSPLLRTQIVFMVFLRNPVARTHSHYYQFLDHGVKNGNFKGCAPEQYPPTFQAAAILGMKNRGTICNCACDSMFSNSFYVESFKRYFKNFMPAQFHIVPFNLAIGAGIVEYTWKLLGMRPSSAGVQLDMAKENGHKYFSLETELEPKVLVKFVEFINSVAGSSEVAQVLYGSGAKLYQHDGRTVDSIQSWLADNWGSDR